VLRIKKKGGGMSTGKNEAKTTHHLPDQKKKKRNPSRRIRKKHPSRNREKDRKVSCSETYGLLLRSSDIEVRVIRTSIMSRIGAEGVKLRANLTSPLP